MSYNLAYFIDGRLFMRKSLSKLILPQELKKRIHCTVITHSNHRSNKKSHIYLQQRLLNFCGYFRLIFIFRQNNLKINSDFIACNLALYIQLFRLTKDCRFLQWTLVNVYTVRMIKRGV